MKTRGIVRKVDELGRIVIPKEIRKILGIEDSKTHLEIFTEDDTIIFQKYRVGRACSVTNKVTIQNKAYTGNVVLIPEGKKTLFHQF
ncbi:AbrB/MazE/SpoVT family DNA-binding domain-containing protein [Priestia megaterium]|jgi:transcriptional pleiotropic regulator of transition state genes|uniref:AbrB/MazE/SpoVT family DNA-binding domain-containing protein n=1 Tax=Priestia megaterium TaxID=1404 RepID=UPI002A6B77A0|nr:AbrB/MazE/SpoVT family DNA-binding domain-containing protein [Priestia megaterium]MDY0943896.1 AbrB/MazE/SpoVT family DNA-binding domain-containing protein [Priestia megaterium]